MVNLRIGSYVKVKSPKKEWRRMPPCFVLDMDKYVGGTYKVVDINEISHDKTIVLLEGLTLLGRAIRWKSEWLEIISRPVIEGDAL